MKFARCLSLGIRIERRNRSVQLPEPECNGNTLSQPHSNIHRLPSVTVQGGDLFRSVHDERGCNRGAYCSSCAVHGLTSNERLQHGTLQKRLSNRLTHVPFSRVIFDVGETLSLSHPGALTETPHGMALGTDISIDHRDVLLLRVAQR